MYNISLRSLVNWKLMEAGEGEKESFATSYNPGIYFLTPLCAAKLREHFFFFFQFSLFCKILFAAWEVHSQKGISQDEICPAEWHIFGFLSLTKIQGFSKVRSLQLHHHFASHLLAQGPHFWPATTASTDLFLEKVTWKSTGSGYELPASISHGRCFLFHKIALSCRGRELKFATAQLHTRVQCTNTSKLLRSCMSGSKMLLETELLCTWEGHCETLLWGSQAVAIMHSPLILLPIYIHPPNTLPLA